MWGAIASAGLSILGGIGQASAQRKVAKANYRLDVAKQDLSNAWNLSQNESQYNQALQVANSNLAQLMSTNEAVLDANVKNTAAAHYKAGLLQLQTGLAKKQQAADRTALDANAAQAFGLTNANAAASGTIGSSIEAVGQDISRQLGEAMVRKDEEWDIQAQNFQTQMHDLYSGLDMMLRSGQSANTVIDPTKGTALLQSGVNMPIIPSTGDIILGAVGKGIMNYASAAAGLGGSSGLNISAMPGIDLGAVLGSGEGATWSSSFSLA